MTIARFLNGVFEDEQHSETSIALKYPVNDETLQELINCCVMLEYNLLDFINVYSHDKKNLLRVGVVRGEKYSFLDFEPNKYKVTLSIDALQALLSFLLVCLRDSQYFPNHIDIELTSNHSAWQDCTFIFAYPD
ncbi:MAG: hypothetical protein KDA65_12225 [Planctomycetaceae bacterium]|nr:hypothetical protein [Planctomycetaceae bacterium]